MANQLKQTRSQRTRDRFLESTSALLNEGLSEFAMPAVAARAEMSVGALYEHFRSKNDLLAAVYEDYARRRSEFVHEAFAGGEGTSRDKRIRTFLAEFSRWYAENAGVLRSFIQSLWLDADRFTTEESSKFDDNIRRVAIYLCGTAWRGMTRSQRAGAERIVSYAIILLRESVVIRLTPSAMNASKSGAAITRDIESIVADFLAQLIETESAAP